MSRIGAMIEYALEKVVDAAANGVTGLITKAPSTSAEDRPVPGIGSEELPHCMAFDVSRETGLTEFRQREEVTTISLAYVAEFDSTQNPKSEMLAIEEKIEAEIWDGNVIDTDAAGFFAYISGFGLTKSETQAERRVLLFDVTFLTTDVEDSAFALTES